jgi:hypothetical protein
MEGAILPIAMERKEPLLHKYPLAHLICNRTTVTRDYPLKAKIWVNINPDREIGVSRDCR